MRKSGSLSDFSAREGKKTNLLDLLRGIVYNNIEFLYLGEENQCITILWIQ